MAFQVYPSISGGCRLARFIMLRQVASSQRLRPSGQTFTGQGGPQTPLELLSGTAPVVRVGVRAVPEVQNRVIGQRHALRHDRGVHEQPLGLLDDVGDVEMAKDDSFTVVRPCAGRIICGIASFPENGIQLEYRLALSQGEGAARPSDNPLAAVRLP